MLFTSFKSQESSISGTSSKELSGTKGAHVAGAPFSISANASVHQAPNNLAVDRVSLGEKYGAKWLSYYREKRARATQKQMTESGSFWKRLPSEATIPQLSARTLTELRKQLSTAGLQPHEKEFLGKVNDQQLAAVHFTNNDLRDSNDIAMRSGMSVLSRKQLEQNGTIQFRTENTPGEDIAKFATHGHVFFSLEPGRITGAPMKNVSGFGKNSYRLDLDHPQFQQGFITQQDMLLPSFQQIRKEHFPFLDQAEINRLNERAHHPEQGILSVSDLRAGMGMQMIADLRDAKLSDENYKKMLKLADTPEGFNSLLNRLYRPELKVPNKVAVLDEDYAYFRTASDFSRYGNTSATSKNGPTPMEIDPPSAPAWSGPEPMEID